MVAYPQYQSYFNCHLWSLSMDLSIRRQHLRNLLKEVLGNTPGCLVPTLDALTAREASWGKQGLLSFQRQVSWWHNHYRTSIYRVCIHKYHKYVYIYTIYIYKHLLCIIHTWQSMFHLEACIMFISQTLKAKEPCISQKKCLPFSWWNINTISPKSHRIDEANLPLGWGSAPQ